jgi:hypothetical protein
MLCVGVGEKQPFTRSSDCQTMTGIALAIPASGQLLIAMNDAQFGVGRSQRIELSAGAVGGGVVQDNDFKIGILLLQQ